MTKTLATARGAPSPPVASFVVCASFAGLLALSCSCHGESQASPYQPGSLSTPKSPAATPKSSIATPEAAASTPTTEPVFAISAESETPSSDLGPAPSTLPGRVGFTLRLGGERFMIWGALPSGMMPKGLATSPDASWLFSSNMGDDAETTLSVYRTDPFSFERHVGVAGKAIELIAGERELFVTNSQAWGKLQVFSLPSFELVREVSVPGFPKWMHRHGDTFYVSLWALDGISRVTFSDGKLEPGKVETLRTKRGTRVRNASRNKNPRGLALTRDGKTLYVANNADESLSLIDTASFSERTRIRVGYAPRHILSKKDSDTLFISLTGNDSVLEFDAARERPIREIPVGKRPKTIALSHDGRFLYSANFADDSLSIVDLHTRERIDLPLDLHKPSGLAVRSDDRFLYVSGFCTHDVWAIERVGAESSPTLPLGPDHDNQPCFDCPSSFEGCPYYAGPTPLGEQGTAAPHNDAAAKSTVFPR